MLKVRWPNAAVYDLTNGLEYALIEAAPITFHYFVDSVKAISKPSDLWRSMVYLSFLNSLSVLSFGFEHRLPHWSIRRNNEKKKVRKSVGNENHL